MDSQLRLSSVKYFLVAIISLLLIACGGSSSGSGNSDNSAANDTAAPVDFSSKSDNEVTSLSGTAFSLGGAATSFTSLDLSNKPLTGDCDNVGGSYDIPGSLGSGIGTYTFVNCSLFGLTLDGQFIIATSSLATFDTSITLNAFSMQVDTSKLTFSGVMQIASSVVSGVETGKISSNGGTLNFKIESPTFNDDIQISNYDSNYTDDTNVGLRSSDYSYTVSSIGLGGSVDINTIKTIMHNYDLDPFPYDGAFEITGASNGNVRVTILGDGSSTGLVRVEIDKDGDTIYETSKDVSWSEFGL